MKAELASLDVIRVETVLSRFPIHRLAKLGTVPIEIREEDGPPRAGLAVGSQPQLPSMASRGRSATRSTPSW